jgi:DNA polymerase-3 subunit beta
LAHNPEQEEAEEEMEIDYNDEELAIGFNVGYLLDVLTVITADKIKIRIKDESSSCLIEGGDSSNSRYVVMPMRL